MSQTKLIIIGGVSAVVIIGLMLFLALGQIGGPPTESVTFQFWGVFDEGNFYEQAIGDFSRLNPGVRIVYRKFNPEDYEQALINAFAAGTGPDVWLMHNTWLPKHFDLIQPLPQEIPGQKEPLMTIKSYQDQFLDVTFKDLTYNGSIYAMPLYVDTLGIFYNKDIFNSAGITRPPRTWEDFNETVRTLTEIDSRGNIAKSAAAIGTAANINRSTDILMLLMLQSGVKMTDDTLTSATFSDPINQQNVGETALRFYTDFANPSKSVYTWNDRQHYSIDAFVEGNAAMMFNYSHHIATIRSKSARFNFATAKAPQILGAPFAVNYANYWAPTVAKQSKNPVMAWRFLVYLASADAARSYIVASNRPSARREFAEQQKNDPDLGVFAEQAISARSWWQVDNSAIETIFAEMINDVNFGRLSVRDALGAAENKVNVLMRRSREGL